ncbi:MAG: serine hydrolase [Vicinamibacterales bacterium]|nr:serine hydrolase [Vicinamibacterales bacterium]
MRSFVKQGRFTLAGLPARVLTAIAITATLTLAPASLAFAQAKSTPARATAQKPAAKKATPTAAQRRAAAARARAAAQARELRDLQTPRFTVDALGREVPVIRAAAAIIYNPETHEVLYETNAQDQRSIASITKVMTALVFLETHPDLDETIAVAASDVRNASVTYLHAGARVTKGDLLNLLLIGSDNAAARALARISPYGSGGFIDRMNEKAADLGLATTHYADPSGLLAANMSSAYDMARLIAFASTDEAISAIMRKTHHSLHIGKRTINVSSTNQLLKAGEYPDSILGGKTGFISRAGYCFATLLRLPQSGQQVAVVVLGAPSSASRFWATRHLLNWMSAKTEAAFAASLSGEN